MPNLPLAATLLAIGSAIFVAIDCQIAREVRIRREDPHQTVDRLSDILILIIPFSALLLSYRFWEVLLYTTVPVMSIAALQWVCYKKEWLASPPEIIMLSPGSYLLTVVLYFIFFHEGPMAVASQTENIEQITESKWEWASLWPYVAYMASALLCLTRQSTNSIALSTLIMIVATSTLPFFTGYYWWSILAGFGLFVAVMNQLLNRLEISVRGGFAFISASSYLMAAGASVVAYALLY